MWNHWGKLAETFGYSGALAMLAAFLGLAFVREGYPAQQPTLLVTQLVLLLIFGLGVSAAVRFSKKQKEWEDSVRTAPWTVRGSQSEIRRRPVSEWAWTLAILALLLYTMSDDRLVLIFADSSKSFRVFWLVLIAFAYSSLKLFTKAIAWGDFGATYFLFDSAFSPGGKIVGQIHFQRDSPIKYDLLCRVACLRRLGTCEHVDAKTLWFSERRISPKEFGIGPTGRPCIPIDFDLPSSALESARIKDDRIVWELSVQPAGPWPGISKGRVRMPYKDRFEIPVLRTQHPRLPDPPVTLAS
jgi:hypothetical protein